MNRIQIMSGRVHLLSDEAVLALLDAHTADVSEEVFNRLAAHVPRKDRCAVWMEVPECGLCGQRYMVRD